MRGLHAISSEILDKHRLDKVDERLTDDVNHATGDVLCSTQNKYYFYTFGNTVALIIMLNVVMMTIFTYFNTLGNKSIDVTPCSGYQLSLVLNSWL